MLRNGNGEAVVLLHGLWMGAWALGPLERRFERAGYRAYRFGYPTTRKALEENVATLAERIAALEEPVVHIVAHSLGGLVTIRYLRDHPDAPPGKVVLLGSPIGGSAVARRLVGWGWHRRLLGAATPALTEGAGELPEGREVLMIAGRLAFGLGQVLPGLKGPSDGVVEMEETKLPGLAGHLVVPINHTGLLFSRRAVEAAVLFLEERGQGIGTRGQGKEAPAARPDSDKGALL